jgi:predicted TIM-barrel fold metal-dependent hydrolase
MSRVDLSEAEVVDAHTHPYRLDDLLARDSSGFEARMTFMGESFDSSSHLDPGLRSFMQDLAASTMLVQVTLRWLAAHLGCDPTREAVTAARDAVIRADPLGYTKGLLDAVGVVEVLADEGYPQPPITRQEFEAAIGVPVHRVARLEPWILEHRGRGFDDLVSGVEHEAATAASDPRCVAYKSIIAYRTGLDVTHPGTQEATEAYERWRGDDFRESREHSKPVRDFLLHRALDVARAHDRPFHIHSGGGDPDIQLAHARPQDLWPLLVAHQHQPVVLIHTGFPWMPEAAYIASVLPHVYLELSELIPWGWSMVDWALEVILGTAPGIKVLYGSDEVGEPELLYISARMGREALERVLRSFVDRDHLTLAEAERLGADVLAGNARRLHGLGG